MEGKPNCWEFMNCPYRNNADDGVAPANCPAFSDPQYNGINDGQNGGRLCWSITGTQCHATLSQQLQGCLECDFYRLVKEQEGPDFTFSPTDPIPPKDNDPP